MAPSFYKIFLDPPAPHLPLPPDFVSKHMENNNMIPNGPITVSANGGYSWRLEIKQIGDSYCFTNGWSNVVQDTELSFADFLYFRLVDQTTFKMSIYSPNGCERLLPPNMENEGGGVDENVTGAFENVVLDDDDEKNEENVNNEDQQEEEDDDDPFFTKIITRTQRKMLRFPAKFQEMVGINGEGSMAMKNLEGKEWVMGLKLDRSFRSKRYCLMSGWIGFWRENGLSEGDECVFKFIRSEGKLLLAKVTKKMT